MLPRSTVDGTSVYILNEHRMNSNLKRLKTKDSFLLALKNLFFFLSSCAAETANGFLFIKVAKDEFRKLY